ncbi:extracellular calcium-sensing receptor-like [Conger conger]|uniref:extracellular calcium-sensing receptor-like n=1 Tax=Conger conger TaxID=82655 RepID=UPI002A5A3D07|nr:extracellular calcium-sensing receptor-like [Conger conger]
MLGAIFPVFNKEESRNVSFQKEPHGGNCVGFDLRAYRWAQVMMFTIKEINEDQSLLPNISLGYAIYDSCASPTNTLRAALTLVSRREETKSAAECNPPISAVIAESGSSQSAAAAGALGPFGVPMVSYFSTCACLSDKIKYPTFFRTIPSDYHQAKALASLVRRFGWSWIGAIQADNDYGRNGIMLFTEEVKKFGVCIAFIGTVLRTYPRSKILDVVEMIKRSTVRVILAFVPEGDLYPLMQELVMQNITGIQWIASEAWITAARPSTIEIFRSFGGAIGFATRKMAMPKLKDFLVNIDPLPVQGDPFVRDFWETMVSDRLKSVNFVNSYGETVFFDENGDPPASYDIINWQLRDREIPEAVCTEMCPSGSRKAQIKGKPTCCFDCIPCADGTIANTTGATDCIPCPLEYWSNKAKDQCIPKDIEFLSYHEGMGIALTVVSLSGVCLAFATIVVFFNFKNTPIVKANNSELSCLLLFSLLLCFLCPLTFIGEPTVWSCMLRHTVFGITFALCISCVLGKTIVVVTAFRATLPNNNMARKFGPMQQRIIVCSCTTVQIFICLLWLTLNPPFPDRIFKQSDKTIILECNTGSETAFYAVLGYIGILSAVCLVLAFLARKLPDNFNEAKFISFSMLIFCAVWLTFIPAYVSSPGKYTVAVEIFAILSSTFGLLFCIFAPKCYIILIKPEKNTRNNVMGKLVTKRL